MYNWLWNKNKNIKIVVFFGSRITRYTLFCVCVTRSARGIFGVKYGCDENKVFFHNTLLCDVFIEASSSSQSSSCAANRFSRRRGLFYGEIMHHEKEIVYKEINKNVKCILIFRNIARNHTICPKNAICHITYIRYFEPRMNVLP